MFITANTPDTQRGKSSIQWNSYVSKCEGSTDMTHEYTGHFHDIHKGFDP